VLFNRAADDATAASSAKQQRNSFPSSVAMATIGCSRHCAAFIRRRSRIMVACYVRA